MDTYDIKKALPSLYRVKPGDFHVVEVPELSFLPVDGIGVPWWCTIRHPPSDHRQSELRRARRPSACAM